MKIKVVGYSALISLGNYNNERFSFSVEKGEDESVEEIVESLRQKVKELGGPNAEKVYIALYEGRAQLTELERKIKKATEQWNATAEFLRKQGLKPDAIDMPQFINLLPEFELESSSLVDGEIEEDEE